MNTNDYIQPRDPNEKPQYIILGGPAPGPVVRAPVLFDPGMGQVTCRRGVGYNAPTCDGRLTIPYIPLKGHCRQNCPTCGLIHFFVSTSRGHVYGTGL